MHKKIVRDNSSDTSTGKDLHHTLGTSFEKGAKVKNGTDIVAKRKRNDKLLGS